MTNRKDLIDEALLRPGRFEVQLELKLPDLAGREAILRIHTGALAAQGLLAPSLQLRTIAQRTASFSGASLSGLVRSATSRALSRVVAALPKGATEIPSLSGATLRLRAADFLAAVREVKKARGLSREELRRYRGPLLRHSDAFDEAWHTARRLVAPFASAAPVAAAAAAASSTTRSVDKDRDGFVKDRGGFVKDKDGFVKDKDGFGRIGSVLITGPAGGGRTSFAAQLAAACNFSFVQVLSADELRGASEGARLHALQTMAEDAAASDTAAIVLDDIERLLGHVLLSHHPAAGGIQETIEATGAMSPAMLEALLALLRRPPPRGRSLVIIGTTAHYPLIARTALLHTFDARVELPPLEHPAGVYELLRLAGATQARAAAAPDVVLDEMAEAVPVGATIKQVLRALELSRVPEAEVETMGAEADGADGAEAEVEDAEKAAIEAEEAALSAAEAALAAEEAKQKAAASSGIAASTRARATSSDGALLTATVSAEGVARVDEMAESGEAAEEDEEAEAAKEAEAGYAEDDDEEEDESPVMVTEPLLYVPVDVARFRELLSLSPWALRLKEHGGGGARTPVAHVHVVGANETMPAEAVRWAGVPSRSRGEGHHTDDAEQF
jgi:vesicle-fusing ATPase